MARRAFAATPGVHIVAGVVGIGERQYDLLAQHALDMDEYLADEVPRAGVRRQHLLAEIPREHHAAQPFDDVLHRGAAGEAQTGFGEEYLVCLVVLLYRCHDPLKIVTEHDALSSEYLRFVELAQHVIVQSDDRAAQYQS